MTTSLALSELLSPLTIQLHLAGAAKEAVLAELVEHVPELHGQPEARLKLLRALLEREQLHSTGLGDGIALPHARNALVGLVNQPSLVFGRSPAGVDYGAIDCQPTHLFFLLIAPTVTQHLAMLARISRLLRDAALRNGLMQAQRPEDVIRLIREAEARYQAS
jgi:mannitol/fructose-specific phosphotransferase system IIA component (Ntr-type)